MSGHPPVRMMSGPGEISQPPPQLGDYRVGKLVAEGVRTQTFEAEQISVRRKVLLERIKPGVALDEEVVGAFLADVRAKAAVDHPVVGSVYQGVEDGELVYYTRELLQGRSLAELHEGGEEFDPRRIAALLGQLGEAIHYLNERGMARLPLEPGHLVLGHHDVLRMVNLAVAGGVDPVVETHDRQLVSELLLDLVAVSRPGSTRLRKLLAMLGGDEALSWDRVGHTAKKLSHELSEGAKSVSQPEVPTSPPASRRNAGAGVLMPFLLGLLVLGAMAAGGVFLLNRQGVPKARPLNAMVRVTGATSVGPHGEKVLIPAYWIDAHEVTIAEYAEFLDVLEVIGEDQRDVYDHRDQPNGKDGHGPEDWTAMRTAAEKGGSWKELPVTLNCPVVNLDWWDAYAYANWRGGRLPSLAEWLAAAQGTAPATSGWGAVDSSDADRTPDGVHGLAGNVSEWVRDPGVNPAFPMNPKASMACGASYRHPRNGFLACTWLESRDTKRPDLGFRIIRVHAP